MLVAILLIVLVILIICIKMSPAEHFGACSYCDGSVERTGLTSVNPYVYPYSGSGCLTDVYRSQWQYGGGDGKKPPNSTDAAEAMLPGNVSGMNVLTVPDQEYLTN